MVRPIQGPVIAGLMLTAALALAACHEEGPGERAGRSLDKTGQSIQDTINPPGPAQKAGRAIDKATGAKPSSSE